MRKVFSPMCPVGWAPAGLNSSDKLPAMSQGALVQTGMYILHKVWSGRRRVIEALGLSLGSARLLDKRNPCAAAEHKGMAAIGLGRCQ